MKGMFRRARLGRLLLVAAPLVAAALVGAATASADTSVSQTADFTYTGTNTCTGEAFAGTGTMHFLTTDNLSTSGTLMHDLDVHIDGLKATALISGKKYVVQDVYDDHFVFAGADEESFAIVAHFVRVGEDGTFILGDDFYEYMRTHITTNDAGLVTAFSIDTSDDPCQ